MRLIDKILRRRPKASCYVPETLKTFLADDQGLITQWLDRDTVTFPAGDVPSEIVFMAHEVWVGQNLTVSSLTDHLSFYLKTYAKDRPEGYTQAQIRYYTRVLKAHLSEQALPFGPSK